MWRSEIARQLVLGPESESVLESEVCAAAAVNYAGVRS
jgi:hypothetical protein